MNFDFLPWPIQVLLLLSCVGVGIHAAITRRKTDRKGMLVMYYIMIIYCIILTVITILRYNTKLYVLYPDAFINVVAIGLGVIYLQLSFLVFTFKGDRQKVKKARISYGFMTLCVIGLIIMYFTL